MATGYSSVSIKQYAPNYIWRSQRQRLRRRYCNFLFDFFFFFFKSFIKPLKHFQALDDLSIRRESCQIQPADAIPQLQAEFLINCGFEGNYCNWMSETRNTRANWTLTKASAISSSSQLPPIGALSSQSYISLASSLPTG